MARSDGGVDFDTAPLMSVKYANKPNKPLIGIIVLIYNLIVVCFTYYLRNNLSIIKAIAPSPVTLQAVPKLSIAIYKAIISAWAC